MSFRTNDSSVCSQLGQSLVYGFESKRFLMFSCGVWKYDLIMYIFVSAISNFLNKNVDFLFLTVQFSKFSFFNQVILRETIRYSWVNRRLFHWWELNECRFNCSFFWRNIWLIQQLQYIGFDICEFEWYCLLCRKGLSELE